MTTGDRHNFEPWRHGGWYVTDVIYPSGACGCVSRNYSDRKWRIVDDSRAYPGSPTDRTFPNRGAAADAEAILAAEATTGGCRVCNKDASERGLDVRFWHVNIIKLWDGWHHASEPTSNHEPVPWNASLREQMGEAS